VPNHVKSECATRLRLSLNKYEIELNNPKPTIGISFILLLNHI